jgi:hypothetical protein
MRYPSKKPNNPLHSTHRLEDGLIHTLFYQQMPDESRVPVNEFVFTPDQFRALAFEMLEAYDKLGFSKNQDDAVGFFE